MYMDIVEGEPHPHTLRLEPSLEDIVPGNASVIVDIENPCYGPPEDSHKHIRRFNNFSTRIFPVLWRLIPTVAAIVALTVLCTTKANRTRHWACDHPWAALVAVAIPITNIRAMLFKYLLDRKPDRCWHLLGKDTWEEWVEIFLAVSSWVLLPVVAKSVIGVCTAPSCG